MKKYLNSLISFSILQLFAEPNTHTTVTDGAEGGGLSAEMKTYYDTQLLENARNDLYFAQFGKKQGLPKGKGKTVEWRKWDTFSTSTTPLTEGVTPNGDKLTIQSMEATIEQYGRYGTFSDVLEFTALDDVILGATEEFGATGAETMDIVTRNALLTNANVFYAPDSTGKAVTTRATLTATSFLTSAVVNKAVTILKKNKTPKINGDYIAIIHPSVAMDLRNSDGWLDAHKYASPDEIYNGEIGKLHGCRFVESNNCKVWGKDDESTPSTLSVYGCLFFGKDAYGVVDPDGAGMHMIVKGKGSAGTADPLDQRSTVGYKFSTAARVLYPERLLRVECTSSFAGDDETN